MMKLQKQQYCNQMQCPIGYLAKRVVKYDHGLRRIDQTCRKGKRLDTQNDLTKKAELYGCGDITSW